MDSYYTKENRKLNRSGELTGTDLERFKEDRSTAIKRSATNFAAGPVGRALLKPIRNTEDLATQYERDAADIKNNNQRPDYQIPNEYFSYLTNAKNLYEADRSKAESTQALRVGENVSAGVDAARKYGNTADVLSAIANIQKNANTAYQDIGMQAENRKRSYFQNYMNALDTMGQQKQQQWMFNNYQPYMQNLSRMYELQSAAAQNRQNAANMTSDLTMEGIDLATSLAGFAAGNPGALSGLAKIGGTGFNTTGLSTVSPNAGQTDIGDMYKFTG